MSAGGAAAVTLALLLCVYNIGDTLLNNIIIDRAHSYTADYMRLQLYR